MFTKIKLSIFQKAMNTFFGWHYVAVKDCRDLEINRVRFTPFDELTGTIVSRSFIIDRDGELTGAYNPTEWMPMTFDKADFFNCPLLEKTDA